jgi:hypothetical protein
MCDAARGEPIARMEVRSYVSGSSRCRNPNRVACPFLFGKPAGADEAKRQSIDTLRRRSAEPFGTRPKEARERRSGEILIKAFAKYPGRAKPRGASDGCSVKPTVGRTELWIGTKPRNRGLLGRSGASALETTAGETVGGSFQVETSGYLF